LRHRGDKSDSATALLGAPAAERGDNLSGRASEWKGVTRKGDPFFISDRQRQSVKVRFRHLPPCDKDIERCECGGQLKIFAAIENPVVNVRILTHLGLPVRVPPHAQARPLALFNAP